MHSIGVVADFLPKDGTSEPRLIRYSPDSGLRVNMLVHVHPKLVGLGCDEARVDVVISGTPGFWREHKNDLNDGVTRLAIGWDSKTKVVRTAGATTGKRVLVTINPDPQAPLQPALYLRSDKEFRLSRPNTKAYFGPKGAGRQLLGVVADIPNWSSNKKPLQLRFKTPSWLERRAFGSCYVNLPTLPANGAVGGQTNAVHALYGRKSDKLSYTQPPTVGRTVLHVDGDLSLADTTPAPNDFKAVAFGEHGSTAKRVRALISGSGSRAGPVWRCRPSQDLSYLRGQGITAIPPEGSFSGNACGAVAVVSAPRADDLRGSAVLVFGVLIGFFFDRFSKAFARFWGRKTPDS